MKSPTEQELSISLDPLNKNRLIEQILEACAAITQSNPLGLGDVTLILPTRRLANQLTSALLAKAEACALPHMYTLDLFMNEWAPHTDEAAPKGLDNKALEFLLMELIESGEYQFVASHHAHEVAQFFNEIIDHKLEDTIFDQLEEVIESWGATSEIRLETILGRCRDVKALYLAVQDFCDRHHMISNRKRAAQVSQGLAEQWQSELPFKHLWVAGFSSFLPRDEAFFQTLAAHPQVSMIGGPPFAVHAPVNPLKSWNQLFHQREEPLPLEQITPTNPPQIFACESPLSEISLAIQTINKALSQGVQSHEIALVVTDEGTYGANIRQWQSAINAPINNALTIPIGETIPGRFLQSLFDLGIHESSAPALQAFATNPIVLKHWSNATKTKPTQLLLKLNRALTHFRGSLKSLNPSQDTALSWLQAIIERLAETSKSQTQPMADSLSEWEALYHELIESFKIDRQNPLLYQAATDALASQWGQWAQLASLSHTPITRLAAVKIFSALLSGCQVRQTGDQLSGIQILSVEEARHIPFRVAVLLGAVEGTFPRAMPHDLLLHNGLKSRAGLPGWAPIEGIEETTFYTLVSTVDELIITHPLEVHGEPKTRSRFLDPLLSFGKAQTSTRDAQKDVLELTGCHYEIPVAQEDQLGMGPLSGAKEFLDTHMALKSASSLERLLRCPYRFLLSKFGLRPESFRSDEDPMEEGEWLHQVLETLFTGYVGDEPLVEPFDVNIEFSDLKTYVVKRLITLTDLLAPDSVLSSPLRLHLELKSWPAFADYLVRLHTPKSLKQIPHGLREYDIPHDSGVNGRIDAVDGLESSQGAPFELICDYKRNNTPTPAEVKRGDKPQLLLYAETLEKLGQGTKLADTVIGYFSILKGEWCGVGAGSAVLPSAKASGLVGRSKETLEDMVVSMNQRLEQRWEEILDTSRFSMDSQDSNYCTYCDFQGICRRSSVAPIPDPSPEVTP
jgi:RecB family exonuclease